VLPLVALLPKGKTFCIVQPINSVQLYAAFQLIIRQLSLFLPKVGEL
jgi:hypothetical protein